MKRKRFINLEFLLAGLVLILFVGGFFFVFYEFEIAPSVSVPEDREQKSSETFSVARSPSTNRSAVISLDETVKNADPEKILFEKSGSIAETVSPEADFGVEGAVFALESGLPLNACRVSFNGQSQVTDQSGEFHLWLEGAVGRLSFSCTGFKTF